MSDYRMCRICRSYGWFGSTVFPDHTCKPIWECRPAWYGDDDDWTNVRASDAEEAAEKFAERHDCESGDYAIVSGHMRNDVVIQARKPGEEKFERWDIEAEAVPTYRATKLDDPVLSPQVTGIDAQETEK